MTTKQIIARFVLALLTIAVVGFVGYTAWVIPSYGWSLLAITLVTVGFAWAIENA